MLNETLRAGELEVQVSGAMPTCVVLRGKSNHRDPEAILCPIFSRIIAQLGGPEATLELHFEHLEFFNSSTITAFIQFIKDVRGRRVKTHVTYNAFYKWQKIFFDALGVIEKTDDFLRITAVTL